MHLPPKPTLYSGALTLAVLVGVGFSSACAGEPSTADHDEDGTEGTVGDGDGDGDPTGDDDGDGDGATGRSEDTAEEPPTLEVTVSRTPEECPHAFEGSLAPVDTPVVHPKNSAQRVQYLRRRLERVDVIEASTYRVLFSVDEATVQALRRTPADSPISWEPELRTASLPAWPVALLFYISGEPRPFLGWFFDDAQVYFVDEPDPWSSAVFEPDGEKYRDVFAIPTNVELDHFLSDRLGEHDPFDKLAWEAQRAEDARCRRVSQQHGDPFPDLPKAIIEPVDDPSAE